MKQRLLFSSIILILFVFQANAQLKVGQNPTTITTNTNLEIEATNASKVVISKDKGRVGIGATTPAKALHINALNDSLRFQSIAGTGAILGIDANDNVYRTGISPSSSNLKVTAQGSGSIPWNNDVGWTNNAWNTLVLTEVTDIDNEYDPTTGMYTASKAGLYYVESECQLSNSNSDAVDGQACIFKYRLKLVSGSSDIIAAQAFQNLYRGMKVSGGAMNYTNCLSALVFLKAGDKLYTTFNTFGTGGVNSDPTKIILNKGSTYMNIYKLN